MTMWQQGPPRRPRVTRAQGGDPRWSAPGGSAVARGRPVAGGSPVPGGGRPIPGVSFTDRVMARVAAEPTPSPGRVFMRSLRHLALRDALAALLAAWRLAFEPTSPMRVVTRASAAALLLSVIVFVGLGGAVVTGGALALLGPDGPAPQQLAPGSSPSDAPDPTPELTPVLTPSPSPTASARPSAKPAATPAATLPEATAKPTTEELITEKPAKRPTAKPTRKPQPTSDDAKGTGRADREERETPEPRERAREKRDDDDD